MRGLAGVLIGTGLAAGALLGTSHATALGPYPDLGSCPVFPNPPAGLPANAPSLPNQAA